MNADPMGDMPAHHFGPSTAPALIARPIRDAPLGIARLSCAAGHTRTMPPRDAFVVMLYLAEYANHEPWREPACPIRPASYPKDSISIIDLNEGGSAHIDGPLEALSFYIPRSTLNVFSDQAASPRITTLACASAATDPILAHLGAAFLPALERPSDARPVFVDLLSLALLAHVAVAYGSLQPPARRYGGLLRWQELRAKEMLAVQSGDILSVAAIAAACNLSRSHFIRAFRQTTGRTPYRWLLEHRVGRAKELLLQSYAIADIALECGFTDQSHFTRVFTNIVGIPPGMWRRQCRGEWCVLRRETGGPARSPAM